MRHSCDLSLPGDEVKDGCLAEIDLPQPVHVFTVTAEAVERNTAVMVMVLAAGVSNHRAPEE